MAVNPKSLENLKPPVKGEVRNPGGQTSQTHRVQRMARGITAALLIPEGLEKLAKWEGEGWGELIEEVKDVRAKAKAGNQIAAKRWYSFLFGPEKLAFDINDLSKLPTETLMEMMYLADAEGEAS